MRFKSIFLNRTLLFCVLFLFMNQILLAQLSGLEKRCLWVIRESMYSKSSIDKALFYAHQSGYDIVFLQIRGRGYAFYNSEFVPKHPKIDLDFDPLSYSISLGDSLGLEIHVWMNTYMLWSSPYEPKKTNHIYHTKKEWTEANIHGKMDSQINLSKPHSPQWEGVYLSPIHPEVNPYLLSVFSEVINYYDIDGLHLDYIRFHDEMYGYNKFGMKEFEKKYNINPRDIVRGIISERFGWEQKYVDSMVVAWKNFKENAITDLVSEINNTIKQSEKNILLSAAVKPNLIESKRRWNQDWSLWLSNEYINFVVPMTYHKEIGDFNNSIQTIKSNLDKENWEKIILGISTYNQDAQSAADKILLARLNGFKGISIFSYDTHKNDLEWFNPVVEAFGKNLGKKEKYLWD